MASFENGVKRYITATATVTVHFPVDWHENAEVACKHCNFYVRATQRCGLTQTIVNYPERFVGVDCPLEEVTEDVSGN